MPKPKKKKDTIEDKNDLLDALGEVAKSPQAKKEKASFWRSAGVFILEVVKVVVISLVIIIPVRYYLIQPFYVKGASMEPNFHDYEYLIIDEISYRFNQPQRGEVVVVRNPNDRSQYFIKRIIGLPGETIDIKDGRIVIYNDDYPSGIELDESAYLSSEVKTQGKDSMKLSSDEFYLLGDNRTSSLDSRLFGPLTSEDVVGRTWIRAWPFNRVSYFTLPTYNLAQEEE